MNVSTPYKPLWLTGMLYMASVEAIYQITAPRQ